MTVIKEICLPKFSQNNESFAVIVLPLSFLQLLPVFVVQLNTVLTLSAVSVGQSLFVCHVLCVRICYITTCHKH